MKELLILALALSMLFLDWGMKFGIQPNLCAIGVSFAAAALGLILTIRRLRRLRKP